MVDRGDPFGLLRYDCRWLKLEEVSQGFFGAGIGSLFARAAPSIQFRNSLAHSVDLGRGPMGVSVACKLFGKWSTLKARGLGNSPNVGITAGP